MQERIGQLEKLVVSFMKTTKPANDINVATNGLSKIPRSNDAQDVSETAESQLSDSFGRISLENAETTYVESAHWTAILDGVRHLNLRVSLLRHSKS